MLRVWDWGDPADPPVLSIHGAFDHGRMMDGIAAAVADLGYRVLAVDMRGHGDSGPLYTGRLFSAAIADLACLAEWAGGPVGMVSHSMGAAMSFGFSACFPKRVRWVVSLDALGPPAQAFERPPLDVFSTQAFDYAVRTFGRSRRVFPDRESMQRQRGEINHRLPKAWLEHLVEHGTVEVANGFVWKWDPAFNVHMADGFSEEGILAEFARIETPMLVLTGGEDDMWSDMTDDEIGARLAVLSTARHKAIPGGGHYLHLEQPEAVMAEIEAFIAEMES